jgi:hypothetical protein
MDTTARQGLLSFQGSMQSVSVPYITTYPLLLTNETSHAPDTPHARRMYTHSLSRRILLILRGDLHVTILQCAMLPDFLKTSRVAILGSPATAYFTSLAFGERQ